MSKISEEDWGLISRTPLFAKLPQEVLATLLAKAHIINAEKKKLLFVRGDPADRFYLVLNGWVKIFLDKPDGTETVLHVMKSGEPFAHPAMFTGKVFPASAEAASDARLLEIPREPFLSILQGDGDLALKIIASLSQRLVSMVAHIEQIQSRSTAQRLAAFLLEFGKDGREGSATIPLPYDKSLIAARLGMKPESLSRALLELKGIGVTSKGAAIEITDLALLRRFAGEA